MTRKFLEEIDNMGEPCRSFDGRKFELTSVMMEIPKSESKIEYYDYMTGNVITKAQWDVDFESNPKMITRWRLLWDVAPITVDAFALRVKKVYDVSECNVYLIEFILLSDTNMNDYNGVLIPTQDWENLCLPWRKFDYYTYRID